MQRGPRCTVGGEGTEWLRGHRVLSRMSRVKIPKQGNSDPQPHGRCPVPGAVRSKLTCGNTSTPGQHGPTTPGTLPTQHTKQVTPNTPHPDTATAMPTHTTHTHVHINTRAHGTSSIAHTRTYICVQTPRIETCVHIHNTHCLHTHTHTCTAQRRACTHTQHTLCAHTPFTVSWPLQPAAHLLPQILVLVPEKELLCARFPPEHEEPRCPFPLLPQIPCSRVPAAPHGNPGEARGRQSFV